MTNERLYPAWIPGENLLRNDPEKIQSISVNQTLADRFIWGSGALVITGTGAPRSLSNVAMPLHSRNT